MALLAVWLVFGLTTGDPIDTARTCVELREAMQEAMDAPDGLGTDGWEKYRPRIVHRYEALSCSFDTYLINTLGQRL